MNIYQYITLSHLFPPRFQITFTPLQKWLKEKQENTEPPTLADYVQGILSRKAQAGKSQHSQSLYNLKDAAKMLNFLQANNIMDMAGLDKKFKSMIGEQLDIQGKLKPVERRLATLKKHIERSDIYFKYRGKKSLIEAEQILFTAARDYLKGVMNGKTTIPTKAWKAEYAKLTTARNALNQRYLAAGTAGAAPQSAGYGAVTNRAEG